VYALHYKQWQFGAKNFSAGDFSVCPLVLEFFHYAKQKSSCHPIAIVVWMALASSYMLFQ
jgi:hypothetical protein